MKSESGMYVAYADGSRSASAQPVVETSAPSGNLISLMANHVYVTGPVHLPVVVSRPGQSQSAGSVRNRTHS